MRRPEPASLLSTVKAVLWSYIGIRRRRDHEGDARKLNPVHVIVAGVIAAAIFVIGLVLVVQLVLA